MAKSCCFLPVSWNRKKHIASGSSIILSRKPSFRDKTMTLAKLIAGNHTGAVTGIKELMLGDLGTDLRAQWTHEVDYGKNIMRGAKAEDAFPDFIARKGREIS